MLKVVAGLVVVVLMLLVMADPECCPDGCTNHSTTGTTAGATCQDAPHACFLCAASVEPTLVFVAPASLAMLGDCTLATVLSPPSITARPLERPPKNA